MRGAVAITWEREPVRGFSRRDGHLWVSALLPNDRFVSPPRLVEDSDLDPIARCLEGAAVECNGMCGAGEPHTEAADQGERKRCDRPHERIGFCVNRRLVPGATMKAGKPKRWPRISHPTPFCE